MKVSRYTFFLTVEGEYYIFNSLSNALVRIDEDTYTQLEEYRKKGAEFTPCDIGEELYQSLYDNYFVTESEKDDFLSYKSIILSQRNQRDSMHLTLAPTMDCCFKCHYCFEQYKSPERMPPEIMDAIVSYVTNIPTLRRLRLTWFGGEPLMAVKQIEQFSEKFHAKYDKDFISNIITTGYHIDKQAIRVLKKARISSVQITLDGTCEQHNSIKFTEDCEDVFERIMRNIELLNDLAPEIGIAIRINVTKDNAPQYAELFHYLMERFKGHKNTLDL